jgi:prophage antirepressor-like protein
MSSEIVPFAFEGVEVRAEVIDGTLWFVVSDLARILGYRDAANAARLLRDRQKGYASMSTPGGPQSMLVTNESGLNRLLIRGNAAKAEAVQDWLTDDVMPSINRTGSYGPAALDASTPEGAALVLQAALTFQTQVLELTAKVVEDAPKVEAYERFISSKSLIKIEVAARRAGLGRTTAFTLLRDARIIQRWNKSPMQAHAHRFEEVPSTHANSAGELITDYTTKVRPEHFDWLVSTLVRLSGGNTEGVRS